MPQRLLAQDIVAASREPLLVLDEKLTVLAASRTFGAAFGIGQQSVAGLPLADVANGKWNIPELTEQLRRVATGEVTVRDVEVQQDTASGPRTFMLHANAIGRGSDRGNAIMLTLEEVTDRRKIETDCQEAIQRANNMLVELNHRVMNSFAMIGAILNIEARTQQDDLCRSAFVRMRARITSIAHLYRNLGQDHAPDLVRADEYIENIVNDLITSLSDPSCRIEVSYAVDTTPLPTRIAVPVGLIVNELVTNSLKHAFTGRLQGRINIEFAPLDKQHVLRISDNGSGIDASARSASGLGRRLSEAFAQQLGGIVEHTSGPNGTNVVLTFPRSDAS